MSFSVAPRTRQGRLLKIVRRTAAAVVGLLVVCALYAALLAHPEVLFRHRMTHASFLVHSRTPVPAGIVAALDSAAHRLVASPLGQQHVARVFVAATPRWYAFFTGPGRRAMAKNYELGNSIYLPMLDRTTLEVVHFDGRRAPLATILAHEAAHTEFQQAVGVRAFWRLPFWKKEGYSELVAYGDNLRLGDMLTALRDSGGATITWPRPNPVPRRYFEAEAVWRYLMGVRHMSVAQVVNASEPLTTIVREMMSAAP